jgi:hypothetical protein
MTKRAACVLALMAALPSVAYGEVEATSVPAKFGITHTFGVAVGQPLGISASAALIIDTVPATRVKCAFSYWSKGAFVQVEPGLGGGKASRGRRPRPRPVATFVASASRWLRPVAARRRSDALMTDLGSLRLPVRLMTMHQAKGREMDAILIIHHAGDYIPDLNKFGRVLFVAASRARRVVSIQLNPTPLAAYAGLTALEQSPEF